MNIGILEVENNQKDQRLSIILLIRTQIWLWGYYLQ